MPDEPKGTTEDAGASDDVQNVKKEFNRKVDNINTKVDSVLKTTQALIEQLNSQAANKREAQVKSSGESKSLNDLLYDDPEEYTRQIEARAEKKMEARIQSEKQTMESNSRIVNKLTNDYPELQDNDSDLVKRAAELLLNEPDQTDPRAWRTVVLEAAQEQGVKPRSRREAEGDFSMSPSTATRRARNAKTPDTDLPQETLDFGRLMGVDVDDAKVKARLKEYQGRNWGRYQ